MGVGVAAAMTAVEGWIFVSRIGGDRIAVPVASWWPTPDSVLLVPFSIVAVASGLLLAAGWRAAPVGIVCAVTQAGFLMWDQQTYSSHRVLVLLLAAYLAFARSDSTWAVRPTALDPPPGPRLLMMTQLSVLYLFAALSKVNLAFLGGGVLRAEVWWPLPTWLYEPLSYLTIAAEIFLAFGLWFRLTRVPATVAGVGLHLSIVTMLEQPLPLVAFALACVPLYPLFYLPRDRLRDWVGGSGSAGSTAGGPPRRGRERATPAEIRVAGVLSGRRRPRP
jgi:hypothetical protein